MALTGTPYIKFQQVDNYSWPTDGREFDDIRIFSDADLFLHDADYLFAANTNNIWKTTLGTRNIPIEIQTTLRSGQVTESYPGISYRFTILDGASPVFSNSVTRNITFPALEAQEDDWTANFYIPGTEKFTKNNYTVLIEADAGNQIDEGRENNNTRTLPLTINQYSGKLFFDDVETDITVTDWTRTSDTLHTISGSGTISGYSFVFNNLDVIKDPVSLNYSIHPSETQTITVAVPNPVTMAGLQYTLPNDLTLSTAGAYADIRLRMPAGLGSPRRTNM
ncbi:hypothetical protein EGM51_17205 [Verrucomicrobia bacterium S94]|nr:hypothetical protein EGM51_17205 [Verrucomicrobia bacterium S94]